MPNGSAFLDEIAELIADRRQQMASVTSLIRDLESEIRSLEKAAQVYRKRHNITESIEPMSLQGKTQIQALRLIARAGNGQFKVKDAKRLMLQAGLIQNPKNASTIVYNVIKRYDFIFEKVDPGVYKLRERTVLRPTALSVQAVSPRSP